MLFNEQGVARQLFNFFLGDAVVAALFVAHVHGFHRFAAGGFFLVAGKHHLDELAAEVAADDGAVARAQHGLVHVELVRVHRALHHGLAQPVAGGDEHHLVKAAFGVDGEHHARCPQIAAHHALHAR